MTMYLYLIIWVYEYIEYDTFYVILWMLMNKVLIETNSPCLFHILKIGQNRSFKIDIAKKSLW